MTGKQPHVDVALALTNVSKSFLRAGQQIQALRGVSLQVRHGLITGLIGPDGAGKTTLMRLVAGLLVADAGEISVLGLDAEREAMAVQTAIGYMPQRFGLYEDLSVQENLDLYADLQGVPLAERAARYQEILPMTGLVPFVSRLAGKLSGGMKQKLGLACALIRPHRLLLLDEPTVGVDPVSRRELWSIVYRLVEDEGMSVLLSTAYLNEAERCDEVILLHEGEVLGQGPPGRFSERMQGRSYAVTAKGLNKRRLQEKLRGNPDVVDAVIQGEWVRLVTATATAPTPETLLPDEPDVDIEPLPPRFEDCFIAELRARQSQTTATANDFEPVAREQRQDMVIQVHNLQRRFGDFYAVKDISFEVNQGEVFGLLGANGAGKSTTFRMLCGLLPPSAGTLQVMGLDLRRAAAVARAQLGYMAQKFSLYGNLSVAQNLHFFSSIYGLKGNHRRQRLDWALQQLELAPVADAVSDQLPLGYKQRLALACALMHEPQILFLDEPTSGVDPLARREFWHRINVLAEQGVTVLVTTHFMEEAEYCDRLAIMAAGEILTVGTPVEIKTQVRTDEHPDPTLEDAFIALIEKRESVEATS